MIICKICNFESETNLVSHITRKHNITISEYKESFPDSVVLIVTQKQKKKISNTLKQYYSDESVRKEMSNKMKAGGSWRCIEYWTNRGYTEEEAKKKISDKQGELFPEWKPENSWMRKEHWVSRGYTEEEAKKKISGRQSKLSVKSSKFKGKKRDKKQKQKISISMSEKIKGIGTEKWVSHFGDFKNNFRSRGEIEVFEFVKKIKDSAESNIFIGPYNVDIVYEGKNVIEFFGDFWHCNPKIYSDDYYHKILKKTAREIREYDEEKIKYLENNGYTVKIIWESDWNDSKKIKI